MEGDFLLGVRVYAPGNIFLQEFRADESGVIRSGDVVLPIDGTYIIQVIRLDAVFSEAQGLYEFEVSLR